jgi:hypothetical protein
MATTELHSLTSINPIYFYLIQITLITSQLHSKISEYYTVKSRHLEVHWNVAKFDLSKIRIKGSMILKLSKIDN